MEVELPKGMKKEDGEAFLKYLASGKLQKKPQRGEDWCGECFFGREGHCGIYSCDCATAITDGKDPPRFLSKKEVETNV